jgi:HK97 family phage major capsid protein
MSDIALEDGSVTKEGDFAKVEPGYADELVRDAVAVKQTPEEYEAQRAAELRQKAARTRQEQVAQRRSIIQHVRARDEDDPKGGFKHVGEYFKSIYMHCQEHVTTPALDNWQRIWRSKTVGSDELSGATGAFGGFAMPTEFIAELLKKTMEREVVYPLAAKRPMSTISANFVSINETTRAIASGTDGGVIPAALRPTAQMSPTRPTFMPVTLTLHQQYVMAAVEQSLLQFSPISLGPELMDIFSRGLAYKRDYLLLRGGGGVEPLGVINSPCKVAVNKVNGQLADTIEVANIDEMWASMPADSQASAIWLAGLNAYPQLAALHRKVGTGGVPVWMPGNGVAGAPLGTINGRPVLLTEKLPTVGDEGDIVLFDPTEYLVGEWSRGIDYAESDHLRFDYNEKVFRLIWWGDAHSRWQSSLTTPNGQVVSTVVTLAARA